ncbi:MAG TPA: isoamylase early set domain-containing protein [Thermodesulfobacteriota bacterium]|nr:isoamylase early set domain-containing protein [Thermodesulfobacteriota bacterium]
MTGRTSKRPSRASEKGGIKKQYLKSKSLCKVTFKLPKEAAPDAQTVNIVGDFNRWNKEETPMKRLRNGDFTVTLELETGREYKFKYLIDDVRWENDWHADRYEPNVYGTDDSVVVV